MKSISKRNNSPLKETTTDVRSPNHLKLYLALIVAVFAFVLYSPSIKSEFTLDDSVVVKENKFTNKGFAGIPEILKTDRWYGYNSSLRMPEYRPASMIFFAIVLQFFPKNPHIFHFFNVMFFAVTCFVLFFVLCELFKLRAEKNKFYSLLFPFICSLLYAAHPIHTEVVDSVKSLDELLCFLFALIAILSFFKYLNKKSMLFLLIGSISYFVSLMSKETGITFLFIIPLAIYFFTTNSFKRILSPSLILVLVSAVYLGIRYLVLKDLKVNEGVATSVLNNSLFEAPDFLTRIGTVFTILMRYIMLLIFPHPLSCDYNFSQIKFQNLFDPFALISFMVNASLGIYVVIKFSKRSIIAFAILFYLITLAPVSNFFMLIGAIMGERFLFIPSLGFCIILTYLILKYTKNKIKREGAVKPLKFFTNNSFPLLIVAIFVLLYSVKTVSRTMDWKDSLSLFSSAVKVSENSATAHLIYGTALFMDAYPKELDSTKKEIILDDAIKEFNRGLDIMHTSKTAHYAPNYNFHLANVYMDKKDYRNAMTNYEIYLNKTPNPEPEVYKRLSYIYNELNLNEKAIAINDSLVKYFPSQSSSYLDKGDAFVSKQDYKNAIIQYQKALTINNNSAEIYYRLGISLANLNKMEEALDNYTKAIEFKKDYVEAYINRAIIYNQNGKPQDALKDFNRAIALNPNFPLAYNSRGVVFNGLKQYEQAIQDYSKAIELDPKYAKAYCNRGKSEILIGKTALACADLAKAKELGNPQAADLLKQYCH